MVEDECDVLVGDKPVVVEVEAVWKEMVRVCCERSVI